MENGRNGKYEEKDGKLVKTTRFDDGTDLRLTLAKTWRRNYELTVEVLTQSRTIMNDGNFELRARQKRTAAVEADDYVFRWLGLADQLREKHDKNLSTCHVCGAKGAHGNMPETYHSM